MLLLRLVKIGQWLSDVQSPPSQDSIFLLVSLTQLSRSVEKNSSSLRIKASLAMVSGCRLAGDGLVDRCMPGGNINRVVHSKNYFTHYFHHYPPTPVQKLF